MAAYSTGIPLPVKLISFTAKRQTTAGSGTSILCSWTTTSEDNSSSFIIGRSNTGSNFIPIGQVAAMGNSSNVQNYRFTDALPLDGTNYYQLKMVDIDTRFTYSPVISVRNSGASSSMEV